MIVHFGVFQTFPYILVYFGIFRYLYKPTEKKPNTLKFYRMYRNTPIYTEKHIENTVIYVLYIHIPKSVANIHQICSKHPSEFQAGSIWVLAILQPQNGFVSKRYLLFSITNYIFNLDIYSQQPKLIYFSQNRKFSLSKLATGRQMFCLALATYW